MRVSVKDVHGLSSGEFYYIELATTWHISPLKLERYGTHLRCVGPMPSFAEILDHNCEFPGGLRKNEQREGFARRGL
jgi:hypothetical protein